MPRPFPEVCSGLGLDKALFGWIWSQLGKILRLQSHASRKGRYQTEGFCLKRASLSAYSCSPTIKRRGLIGEGSHPSALIPIQYSLKWHRHASPRTLERGGWLGQNRNNPTTTAPLFTFSPALTSQGCSVLVCGVEPDTQRTGIISLMASTKTTSNWMKIKANYNLKHQNKQR